MGIKIPLDFSAVEEYEVLEGGVYSAVIEQIRWHEQKEGQKADQLEVQYTITDDEYKGEKVYQWLSFSAKALFRMRDFFDAMGEDLDELEIDEPDDGIAVVLNPDLSGIPVEVKVEKAKHWQDKDRYVNKINTPPVLLKKATKTASRRTRDEEPEEESGKRRGGRSIR